MDEIQQLTEEQAIAIHESKMWEKWSNEEIVRFQLFQERLCVPFGRFHEAVEKVLDRPVWTHEFAFKQRLIDEYLGKRSKPTLEEIINLIPVDKRIIITVKGDDV